MKIVNMTIASRLIAGAGVRLISLLASAIPAVAKMALLHQGTDTLLSQVRVRSKLTMREIVDSVRWVAFGARLVW